MNMQQASSSVMDKLSQEPGYQISPAIIAIIIEIISKLLPMLLEQCNKKAAEIPGIAAEATGGSTLSGMIWWMTARRQTIRHIGRGVYREINGDLVLHAVLSTAAGCEPVNIQDLYSSIQED